MTDSASTMGKVVWFELAARDTQRARKFYGDLFGWQLHPFAGQDYHMSSEAGGAITGAPGRTGSLIYFSVDDLDEAIIKARELGGTCGERQEIPGVGFFAECTDTEGNPIALWEAIG